MGTEASKLVQSNTIDSSLEQKVISLEQQINSNTTNISTNDTEDDEFRENFVSTTDLQSNN